MLDLSKPIMRVEERKVNGEVVFIRHLPEDRILYFADKAESEDEKQVAETMRTLIIEAVCGPNGESLNYTHKQLKPQPFSIIQDLTDAIMSVVMPKEKKS